MSAATYRRSGTETKISLAREILVFPVNKKALSNLICKRIDQLKPLSYAQSLITSSSRIILKGLWYRTHFIRRLHRVYSC